MQTAVLPLTSIYCPSLPLSLPPSLPHPLGCVCPTLTGLQTRQWSGAVVAWAEASQWLRQILRRTPTPTPLLYYQLYYTTLYYYYLTPSLSLLSLYHYNITYITDTSNRYILFYSITITITTYWPIITTNSIIIIIRTIRATWLLWFLLIMESSWEQTSGGTAWSIFPSKNNAWIVILSGATMKIWIAVIMAAYWVLLLLPV